MCMCVELESSVNALFDDYESGKVFIKKTQNQSQYDPRKCIVPVNLKVIAIFNRLLVEASRVFNSNIKIERNR